MWLVLKFSLFRTFAQLTPTKCACWAFVQLSQTTFHRPNASFSIIFRDIRFSVRADVKRSPCKWNGEIYGRYNLRRVDRLFLLPIHIWAAAFADVMQSRSVALVVFIRAKIVFSLICGGSTTTQWGGRQTGAGNDGTFFVDGYWSVQSGRILHKLVNYWCMLAWTNMAPKLVCSNPRSSGAGLTFSPPSSRATLKSYLKGPCWLLPDVESCCKLEY